MAKYSTYIELSPHYESVVDAESEKRNPDLWHEYIIHEDMKDAVEKICDSLKYENPDQRRSFWIHGAYGTGKSYAAIVIKHLFEDNEKSIQKFMSNQLLIPYRERFLSIRKKGKFLVVWENQTTDIKNGTQLLMKMEVDIRNTLEEKLGDKAYYGRKSLVAAAQNAINDPAVNWEGIFLDHAYGLYENYGSVEDFRNSVRAGEIKAVQIVVSIYQEKGWGFLNSLPMFKSWIADIIEGNNLQDTGIVFIWDEFTSYIRDNPTDDVLQPLSEFCKEQPFFMFLIVHRSPEWLDQIGASTYERITHRFHTLNFHISESAAYDLIGSSILTRPGMEGQWNGIKDTLMSSISRNLSDFDNLSLSNSREKFRQLCPIHPMTLSLLAIVAQNFGASQRTLFRFMKDPKEAEQNVGFIHYINNYGPDDWRWLTADFLWDYFFTRESDVKDFSAEAKSAYQHYVNTKESISDNYYMHVFKAAMLLIAIGSSATISNLYSQAPQRKLSATSNTLYKCFVGQLNKEDVDKCLDSLAEIKALSLDDMGNGNKRLQIPYTGSGEDVFKIRREKFEKDHSRYVLFKKDKKDGVFASSIEEKLWDKTGASYNRMYIAACDSGANSMVSRFNEVEEELGKHPYKFGILAVVISESSQFAAMQDTIKNKAVEDKTGRLAIYLLKSPLTKEQLKRWYTAMTHSELAGEEGKSGDAEKFSDEANIIKEEWAASAAAEQIMVVCGETVYPSEYGASSCARRLEKDIIFGSVFTAAPELVVSTNTAFRRNQENTALAGIQKNTPNTQVMNIANGLKQAGVWDIEELSALTQCKGNDAAIAVAKAASFILQRFSQGVQIKLDELWQELQKAPYGYYNCMACGYILGFLLRYYVNSEFSWNKGDNNPWQLTEQNLAQMITSLCSDNVTNNYLSPGSEIWRSFKPYVEHIFRLKGNEAVNETDARKYMSQKCTEAGAPFWVLKYVPAEKFGSAENKQIADKIVDLFCDFMSENGNSEQIMNDIISRFRGRPIRKTLEELYFDQKVVSDAFSSFIFQKNPDLSELQASVGFTSRDLFDAVHQVMQGQVSTWTETQVEEKLSEICIEYQMVAVLNSALKVNLKSIKLLADDIRNAFENLKIPGTVIEKMDYAWIPALKAMRDISITPWSAIDTEKKKTYTDLLKSDAQKVWENIISSKPILQRYMDSQGKICTEEELNDIYNNLRSVDYNFPAADFDERLNKLLNNVEYERNKARIQKLWKEQSGFDSVSDWCAEYAVPIQWVVDSEGIINYISILKQIQDGKKTNATDLHNATQYFETNTISVLKNKEVISNCFIAQIGENYREPLKKYKDVLIARLKTNSKLTADVYAWAYRQEEVRKTIDSFLQNKVLEDAKKNVKSMPENQLREKVIKLLDENPSLYTLFV